MIHGISSSSFRNSCRDPKISGSIGTPELVLVRRAFTHLQNGNEANCLKNISLLCRKHDPLKDPLLLSLFRRVWELENKPRDSDPRAHLDFGRVAFLGLEGRGTSKEIRKEALGSVLKERAGCLSGALAALQANDEQEAFQEIKELERLAPETAGMLFERVWSLANRPNFDS